MRLVCWTLIAFATVVGAQETNQSTNSFFDDSAVKTFNLESILVEGEVENPGPVDLSRLPLRSLPVKELEQGGEEDAFRGAFYYQGYSLFDILDGKKVKKAPANGFSPLVDLYVIAENDAGEKAVFSWGEIFYAQDGLKILLSKQVQAINPSKLQVNWALPQQPRLICGSDLSNVRFLSNPKKITVRSFSGSFATEKPQDIYAPEIRFMVQSKTILIRDINPSIERRRYGGVGYGHGMGYKGVLDVKGAVLKDVLKVLVKLTPEDMRQSIAVVSAKDGYRAVFSVSEWMNRNDNRDALLLDREKSREDGRYVLFSAADFFVDRNVKAVEKIEIVRIR
jgi:hypothetical protein